MKRKPKAPKRDAKTATLDAREARAVEIVRCRTWSSDSRGPRVVFVELGLDAHSTALTLAFIPPELARSIGYALLKLASEAIAAAPATPTQLAAMRKLDEKIAGAQQRHADVAALAERNKRSKHAAEG